MADFKIKSAAGTGNKTLIQGQDQSGSNYAIQIGDAGASTLHNATITAWTPPAGTVLQVVQGLNHAEQSTTSTSFVATGIDVSITPSATSSKVLIMATTSVFLHQIGHVAYYTIYRDSTNLSEDDNGFANLHHTAGTSGDDQVTHINMAFLDSPNTDSAITYQVYTRTNSSSLSNAWSMNGSTSTIICQEIAG